MAKRGTNFAAPLKVGGTTRVDASGNYVGNVTGDVTGNVTGNVSGYALKAEARTATADGTTTGTISAGTTMVTVTCDDANKIIKLPAPVPGLVITLINGATGYELRSTSPTTISINGGAGANAESAVGANVVVVARCVSATKWIATTYATDGTVAALEAAA